MNPNGPIYHFWTAIHTLGFLYNAWSIWMIVFVEFRRDFFLHWLLLNSFSDALNLLDLIIQAKKVFLHDGILVSDSRLKLRRYILSYSFLLDLIAILPTDLLLMIWHDLSPLRINRLAKWNRVGEFIKLTEHRAPWPLGFRLFRLATFCYLLFHWNACFYFWLSTIYGYEDATVDSWTFSYQKIPDLIFPLCDPRFDVHRNECLWPEENWRLRPMRLEELRAHWAKRIGHTEFSNLTKKYAMSFYWSALTLVTLGEQPWPANSVQSVFEIVNTLIGLLIFAAIIGHIGIMVSSAHLAKANFQEFVDGSKRYMRIRQVSEAIRERVIDWIEYQWIWGDRALLVNETEMLLSILPPRLAMELAAEPMLSPLLASPVFSLCEKGLLRELAIRLHQRRFSPGDIVCRRGEIAKELFIVKHGRLEMLLEEEFDAGDGRSSSGGNRSISPRLIFEATNEPNRFLLEGDIFGDWPLVSESKTPYTIRSIGYSCLCTLGHDSMAAAFEEYPHSRRMVRRKANLLRQRHEQRWNWRNGGKYSAKSFDSEEFFFKRRSSGRRSAEIFGEMDEKIGEEEGGETSSIFLEHCSPESRLQEIQKAIICIGKEVEAAEKNFVNSSMELKKWMSALEQEYQEQRPRLKNRLLLHRQWAKKKKTMKTNGRGGMGNVVGKWMDEKREGGLGCREGGKMLGKSENVKMEED